MNSFPNKANVVVIGSGIVGNSVVYHLAEMGWTDIVLLDKGPLPNPGGSTGHASNFIFPIDSNKTIVEITLDSVEQFKKMDVLRECGGMELSRTEERTQELKKRFSLAKSWGIPAEMITPERAKELFPWLNTSILKSALWLPTVSVVDSLRAGTIMRESAIEKGSLSVFPQTEVTNLTVKNGHIESVVTTKGSIQANYVVIACGVWSPRIAKMAGAYIPLYPVVHQMIDCGPIQAFLNTKSEIEYPVIRDMSALMYERQSGKNIEIGSYAHRPILHHPNDIPSIEESKLSPTELPFTQDDFDPQMEDAIKLLPDMLDRDDLQIDYAINGLLSLTPDGEPVLGETPEVKGLWSAAAVWIKEGPGVGRMVAEWMTTGYSEYDNHDVDISRVYNHAKSERHIYDRASESFNNIYGIVHPMEQMESSRGIRTSPMNERQKDLGAKFYETAGWERPHWYESNASLLEKYEGKLMLRENEWDSRWWSPIIHAEHLALRENGGIMDLSAFNIFDITGSQALEYIQKIAVNQMDVKLGTCVYTPLLNEKAGMKADLTIVRLTENSFRIISGSMDGARDKKWFTDHLPSDGSVHLSDMSSAYTTISFWGPKARLVLEKLTKDDISNENFKYGTAKEIYLGPIRLWALRISYVGELGYELHMPCEYARYVWDTLIEEGSPHGIIPVGMGVYGTTARIEKGYRFYGAELDTSFNPSEAGLAKPRVKAQNFIGKEAYLKIREAGPAAILCSLVVDDHKKEKRYMQGKEPILIRDGKRIIDSHGRGSYVTSAGSAPSLGKHVLMAYLPKEHAVAGNELLVEYFSEQYPVHVAVAGSTPLYDPTNEKMKQ